MSKNEEFEPKILLLLCSSNKEEQCIFKISSNFLVSKESSADRIKPETILKAFSDGLDGVMITSCVEKVEVDETRNQLIENRIEVIKRLVDNIGFGSNRILFTEIPVDDSEQFEKLISKFVESIKKLGGSPLKVDSKNEVRFTERTQVELDLDDEEIRVKSMLAETVIYARLMLLEGRISAVIGRKIEAGHVIPAVFETQEALDELVMEPTYNLADIVRNYQKNSQDSKLGIVAYPCDERALNELASRKRVNFDNLELIKVTCTEAQGRGCKCEMSYPGSLELEERMDTLLNKAESDRADFWFYQFSKCIKCYGCRDICPVCSCDLCVLEDNSWVTHGKIPPELSFHLIRYYHMADKCIGCGECEAACPVEIPLATLHHQMIRDIRELFSYEAGFAQLKRSPLSHNLTEKSSCGGGE